MKTATKRSLTMACIFVLLSIINLIMEYRKSNPTDLTFKWVTFAVISTFALVTFIRFRKTKREII